MDNGFVLSMSNDLDAVVIGAGAAGLIAAAALGRAGLAVKMLEARDRIGGRIFTLHDSKCSAPVELGAEFIHGRPPEIWELLKQRKIRTTEVNGDHWCVRNGQLSTCDFFSDVEKILRKMDGRKRDQSFRDFLNKCCTSSNDSPRLREAKEWATGYVSGFNAADPALVGVHWLLKGMRAEEKIEGDRIFRAQHGYANLLQILEQQLNDLNIAVQKSTPVERIRWRAGNVEIKTRGQTGMETVSAKRVLITIPLGVLQAGIQTTGYDQGGAVRFDPDLPVPKQKAINNVMMGKVIRVTLRFHQRFWEDLPKVRVNAKTMRGMSFLFSHDDWFPTWWTMSPESLPFLIGWAPFRCAERLSGQSKSFIVEQALNALHRLMGVSVRELETLFEEAFCHDWQNDPFSRGAYSYGRVGGDGAEQALARPIKNTLFFAGEATDFAGLNGTVHAAMASGKRAANEMIKAAASDGKRARGRPTRK